MQTADHADVSLTRLLWIWASYRITQFLAALKPAHRTQDIAALVANSSNPTGA